MFFLIFIFMFNLSYLFSVLFLGLFIFLSMLLYMSSMIFLKYLVILVYISGVVVFILYISCMCWNVNMTFNYSFIVFSLVSFFLFDTGVSMKFLDLGDFFWMYMFFGLVFSLLVTVYSLNLFKNSGSLRF